MIQSIISLQNHKAGSWRTANPIHWTYGEIFPHCTESRYGSSEQFPFLYFFQNIMLVNYVSVSPNPSILILLASKDAHRIAMQPLWLGIFPLSRGLPESRTSAQKPPCSTKICFTLFRRLPSSLLKLQKLPNCT